ncbi:hypothetical protein [Microbacterium jiangjiandongii]|uniref:hypothetical protein n=1 Tax=Microbacterium jiangjiandongii TaxID=3049071 RepID=UPI00214AAFE1|nr:hypothetical protein [Microbacterium sp. zg.Y843]MCR2814925.1 hypothetical protein [Microbacterium sp. zg.Y843]
MGDVDPALPQRLHRARELREHGGRLVDAVLHAPVGTPQRRTDLGGDRSQRHFPLTLRADRDACGLFCRDRARSPQKRQLPGLQRRDLPVGVDHLRHDVGRRERGIRGGGGGAVHAPILVRTSDIGRV